MTATFIKGLDSFPTAEAGSSIVTIGTFDGIHIGHQAILDRVRTIAQDTGMRPVLITFHPHPRVVVSPESVPMLLTSIEEKLQFIPDFFDGTVLVMQFDQALMNLSPAQFVRQVLVDKVGTKHLIIGYNHGFGKNRSGNAEELKKLGAELNFSVEVVDPVYYDGEPVSSTRIRKAMSAGNFSEAIKLLGHEYAIYGTVDRGIGLGRELGYPTANLKYSHRKLLPPHGVYGCSIQVAGEEKDGMMFIGQNHFNPVMGISVEANIFDFDRDIYGEEVIVYPTCFIRENKKYDSTKDLVKQIKQDKENVLRIIRKGEKTCH